MWWATYIPGELCNQGGATVDSEIFTAIKFSILEKSNLKCSFSLACNSNFQLILFRFAAFYFHKFFWSRNEKAHKYFGVHSTLHFTVTRVIHHNYCTLQCCSLYTICNGWKYMELSCGTWPAFSSKLTSHVELPNGSKWTANRTHWVYQYQCPNFCSLETIK
jgi:hypothetical protein